MSEAQRLIARVLRGFSIRWDDAPGVEMWLVGDRHFRYKVDAQGFVAAEIDKALGGLTLEKRTNTMSSAGMTTNYNTGEIMSYSDLRQDSRWVSGWTEVTE